jgi:hypothetical protein
MEEKFVMPGLVPGIHVLPALAQRKTWMAGTSPAMTKMETGRTRRANHFVFFDGLCLAPFAKIF